MKKLIVALTAITSAVVLNAATVSWTGGNIAESGSGALKTSYMAYLIDNAAYDFSNVSASTIGTAVSKALASTTLSWATSGKASIPTMSAAEKPVDSYVNPNAPTYYMIVLDGAADSAAKYLLSATKTATVTTSGTLAMQFGSQSAATWVAMATPEPTSGLLLLLGFAGLALRRRRA